MAEEKEKAELPIFTIDTSADDILKLRSAFNPYPEQAQKGILVSSIQHPMSNAAMWIKYIATGNVYYVHEPIAYAISEYQLPSPLDESKVPHHTDEKWISFDRYMKHLSPDLVQSGMGKDSDFQKALVSAVVLGFDADSVPLFYIPREAYLQIVREAIGRLEKGDLGTAWTLAHFGFNVASYQIEDEQHSAYAVFDYTYGNLSIDVCPTVVVDNLRMTVEERNRIVRDVSCEVHLMVATSIKTKVLIQALQKYKGTAREHVLQVLEQTQLRLDEVKRQLRARQSPIFDFNNGNYLSLATRYLLNNGIVL